MSSRAICWARTSRTAVVSARFGLPGTTRLRRPSAMAGGRPCMISSGYGDPSSSRHGAGKAPWNQNSIPRGGSTTLIWAKSLGQGLLWTGPTH